MEDSAVIAAAAPSPNPSAFDAAEAAAGPAADASDVGNGGYPDYDLVLMYWANRSLSEPWEVTNSPFRLSICNLTKLLNTKKNVQFHLNLHLDPQF